LTIGLTLRIRYRLKKAAFSRVQSWKSFILWKTLGSFLMILPVPSATAAASRHGFWTHHKHILRSLRVNARQSKIYHFVANFQTMLFISTLLGDNQFINN